MKNALLLVSLLAVSNVLVGCGCNSKPATPAAPTTQAVETKVEDAAALEAKKKAEEATKNVEQAPAETVVETAVVEDNKA